EILDQVVWQRRVDGAVGDVGAPLADAERVAVGRGAGETSDTDGAARAGDVLDDDGLAERGAHRLGHDPSDHVGRAAGRERYDHGEGARGMGLRRRVRDAGGGSGGGEATANSGILMATLRRAGSLTRGQRAAKSIGL